MKLAPGTILGQYEIRSPLGAGSMGEVYRARDTRLDREVAVKVLPEFVSSDPDRLRRFEQEARAAAALNHPNILVVHQMGTYQGMPYLVSELLEGDTLRESLRGGPLPLRKAIDCGVQIAQGLATFMWEWRCGAVGWFCRPSQMSQLGWGLQVCLLKILPRLHRMGN